MILMWLGPVILAVAALRWLSGATGSSWTGLQKRFLAMPESAGLFKTMITTKLCGIGLGGFLRTQYSAVALLNTRAFSRRYAILLLCLSSAGTWITMLGILLAWQVDGGIFLALWFLIWLCSQWANKSWNWQYPVAALGVFLAGTLWVLQKQSILMTILGESELHFWLADGRFPAQLLWLVVSFLVTLLIAVESWAVILALILVVAGSLSLNGAAAFIIGEMLAHVWMLWWRSRKMNQDVKALTKQYALYSTVGLVIAFFVAGLLREAFAWTFTFEASQLTEKSLQFFSLYFVIVVIQALAVMIWGHFATQRKVDEVQKGEYFPLQWISRGLISSEVLDFILKKLNARLDLLLAQKKDLDAKDRAQIPAMFLQEHEHETTQLALWLPLAVESRSKGKI